MPDPTDHPEPNESLRADLAALYRADVRVPPSTDRAILDRAAQEMELARRRRWRLGWTLSVAAAAVLAVVVLVPVWRSDAPQTVVSRANVPGDVNGDGTLDILDALALRQTLGQPDRPPPVSHDLNHDGTTDERDVEAIALAAVRLPEGGLP